MWCPYRCVVVYVNFIIASDTRDSSIKRRRVVHTQQTPSELLEYLLGVIDVWIEVKLVEDFWDKQAKNWRSIQEYLFIKISEW